jgi:hypothetical protein
LTAKGLIDQYFVDLKISLRPSLFGVPGQVVSRSSLGYRYYLDSTPPSGGVFRVPKRTLAIEKVPLSVVHVNIEPQYLVFCLLYLRFSSYLSNMLEKTGQKNVDN